MLCAMKINLVLRERSTWLSAARCMDKIEGRPVANGRFSCLCIREIYSATVMALFTGFGCFLSTPSMRQVMGCILSELNTVAVLSRLTAAAPTAHD